MTAGARRLIGLMAGLTVLGAAPEGTSDTSRPTAVDLSSARHAFYSARYEEAAAMATDALTRHPESLAAFDVRTSALLFDLKRRLGDEHRKRKRLEDCTDCEPLLDTFLEEVRRGLDLATVHLTEDAESESALFFLARLHLNYLWLQNGVLGRRTGWREYREARRSLASVLERNPSHLRARVAMAWIDYIVDTRMPWGTKWLFGGGDRRRALEAMRKASQSDAPFYDLVEARFGLWEMLMREGDRDAATSIARELVEDFPDNSALHEFISAQTGPAPKISSR